uniref:Uncharacterized protein n=1 Tax=Arundo donax TaxID=35708 RepID=A0A0A9GJZ5_ARUDO
MTSWILYLLASPYSLKKSISDEPFLRCWRWWWWSACIAPRPPPPPQRSSAREPTRICPGEAPHTTPGMHNAPPPRAPPPAQWGRRDPSPWIGTRARRNERSPAPWPAPCCARD